MSGYVELSIKDLKRICWDSSWRHRLFQFDESHVITKDEDTGHLVVFDEHNICVGIFDLDNVEIWIKDGKPFQMRKL